ncbi:MAG: hypothetical protein K8S98_02110 [Planctomycetes bacterium]|nr:hypothetical protein [Planctomycetota bacterium]
MLAPLWLFALASIAPQDPPHGRCIWATGAPREVVDWLTAFSSAEQNIAASDAALDLHARRHGWSGKVDEPDRVSVERGARCPEAVLDLLSESPRWCDRVESVWTRCRVAFCLERNGRRDAALALLDQTLVTLRSAPSIDRSAGRLLLPPSSSCIAEFAARLAARSGNWELALAYAEDWMPSPSCVSPPIGDFTEPVRFRCQCLVELGRAEDSLALRRDLIARVRSATGITASCALAEEGPDSTLFAGLVPGIPLDEVVHVMEYWKHCERKPSEWLATPELLAGAPPISVEAALRDADDDTMQVLVAPLLDEEWTSVDRWLAYRLAPTGHPLVGPALEHARSLRRGERDAPAFDRLHDEWKRSRAWVADLSKP